MTELFCSGPRRLVLVDVIVIATEQFETTKDIIGGIAYPAHKYGKVLYEAT